MSNILTVIIMHIIFGCVSNHLAKCKGYDGGFMWGFWLGIIGFLVVGFKPVISEHSDIHEDVDALRKLSNMLASGSLTEDEYTRLKNEILEDYK